MRGPISVAAICGLVLALGAGTAVAAPSKTQFIRQGDALCAAVRRELVPIRERAEAAKSLPEAKKWAAAAAIWTDQIEIQTRFNRRFRAIGIPAGDATARALVADLGRGVVLARAIRDAFVARSNARLAAAVPAYMRFTLSLNRRVQAYGFRVCGR